MLTIFVEDTAKQRRQLKVDGARAMIGRDNHCHVRLAGWRVSRQHAEVFVSNDRVFVSLSLAVEVSKQTESRLDELALAGHPVIRLVLDDPDLRAVPGNLRRVGGQPGDEAELVQRHPVGDVAELALEQRPPGGQLGPGANVRE